MERLVLVDSDFLGFFATYHIKKYYTNTRFRLIDKTLEQVIDSCDKWINEIFKNTKADYYVLALTLGKNFRYKIEPNYKANRIGLKKPNYFNEVRNHLIVNHGAVFHLDYEADDIVNVLKNKYKDEYDCIIASNDQDILSLEGTHYNTTKKQWVTTDKQTACLKFWIDMIKGQSGDGIKGLKGKGESYANKLLLNHPSSIYSNIIFDEYLKEYGSNNGIEEFYKTYKCLRIVEEANIHFKPIKIIK